MKIGIVILNYNSSNLVCEKVRQLAGYPSLSDIVVVDNHSQKEDFVSLSQLGNLPRTHLIRATDNGGYASGNNIGLRYLIEICQSDMVIVSNPDVYVGPELIEAAAKAFILHNDYGILTGVQKDIEGNVSLMGAWPFFSYKDLVVFMLSGGLLGKKKQWLLTKDFPEDANDSLIPVDVVSGCLLCIRSRALVACGYLDEHTFMFYEEDILCALMRRHGWKVGIIRDTSFIHAHRSSTTSIKSYLWNVCNINISRRYYAKQILRANSLQLFILRVLYYWDIMLHFLYQPFKRFMRLVRKGK